MKRFLTTTAAMALIGAPVLAYDNTPATATFLEQPTEAAANAKVDNHLRASNLIGKTVYVTQAKIEDTQINVEQIEWDNVGEVNDILLNRDGSVQAVMLDIGGFLGMGEKTVALSMDKLKLVSGTNDGMEYYVVFKGDRATLENAKEYDTSKIGAWAADPAENQAEAVISDEKREVYAAPAPDVAMEGWERVEMAQLTTEDLTGAIVYDTADKNIGEINELLVSTEGQIQDAILDVGGFLGMGEKQVRVSMESLTIQRDMKEGTVRIYVDASKDALMEQPEYTG